MPVYDKSMIYYTLSTLLLRSGYGTHRLSMLTEGRTAP